MWSKTFCIYRGHPWYWRREIERTEKHATVLCDFLKLEAERFVRDNEEEALLEQFQSDGTPVTTTERHAVKWDNFNIRRAGRVCREYLVQRLWLSTLRGACCVLFGVLRLMYNKTHLTSYAGMVELWGGARLAGHKGFLISHHTFDRAVMSSMARRIKQRAAALELHMVNTAGDEAALLILKTWITVVGCQLHDYHNALKWAVFNVFACKQTMRDTWIVLAALRHAFEQLLHALPLWVTKVSFEFANFPTTTIPAQVSSEWYESYEDFP